MPARSFAWVRLQRSSIATHFNTFWIFRSLLPHWGLHSHFVHTLQSGRCAGWLLTIAALQLVMRGVWMHGGKSARMATYTGEYCRMLNRVIRGALCCTIVYISICVSA